MIHCTRACAWHLAVKGELPGCPHPCLRPARHARAFIQEFRCSYLVGYISELWKTFPRFSSPTPEYRANNRPDTVLITGQKNPNSYNDNSIFVPQHNPLQPRKPSETYASIRREENNVPPIIPLIPSYGFPFHQLQGWKHCFAQLLCPTLWRHTGDIPQATIPQEPQKVSGIRSLFPYPLHQMSVKEPC